MADKKRMGRTIAGAVGLIGLGIIMTEVVNSLKWFESRLTPVVVTLPMLVFYGLYDFVAPRTNHDAASIPNDRTGTLFRWINAVLSLIGLIFLLSIPFLWWGVIKRLAQSASQGGRFF